MSYMKQLLLDLQNEQSEEPILPPSQNDSHLPIVPTKKTETTDETNN